MRSPALLSCFLAVCSVGGTTLLAQDVSTDFRPNSYPAKFTPNWESLADHNDEPEWLNDAKLGIYFHWGPYSVPAYKNEWYPRFMQLETPPNWGRGVKEYHREKYGPPSEFGYHHFIPVFRAEEYDPSDWAELFQSAGARFAGPVAQHHDGFSMWDSRINPNNAKAEGPQKDVLGELFKELRKRDLKTIATFHHSFTGQRQRDGQPEGERAISYYPYHEDYFTSSDDPKLRKLYGNLPEDEFNEYWLSLVQEVVDKYSPDIIWFDSWLDVIPENYQQRMAAHHFNAGASRGQEVVLACKQDDLPEDIRVLDIEQGGMKEMPQNVWMTDITLSTSGWCYVQNQKYKPLPLLIRNMIDVWSKRGVVLLNISPRADGVIIEEQRELLRGLGQWLATHGEAVYNTRPHSIYGYGDAKIRDGSHGGQAATIKYSASDIRFTKSKDGKTLYVFLLGQPEPAKQIEIRHVVQGSGGPAVRSASFLGTDEPCRWESVDSVLRVTTPKATKSNEIATILKVELDKPLDD